MSKWSESASGSVMIWRLLAERNAAEGNEERIERIELRAQKLVAGSLVLLAAYIAWGSITSLLSGERPLPSAVGIGLAVASLLVLGWLRARASGRDRPGIAGDDRRRLPDLRVLLALGRPAHRHRRQHAARVVMGRSRRRAGDDDLHREGGTGGLASR